MSSVPTQDAGGHDYVTDMPYVRTFSNALSPSALRLAAALNGFAPPPEHDFDYLELGSANGDTLIALAAAYPRARFVGIELNAAHVAFATDQARRAELDNVTFIAGDFEQVLHAHLPDFDFVCMYGLLSWIAPPKRKAAIELASARLKPGGLLFASYNALPGWSAVEPLRRLMLDAAAGARGSLERAQRGLSIAKLLDDAGAHYFVHNPAARTMLAAALRNGIPYAVHEYFLPDWHPFYFEDLARELATESLHFVGQLPVYLNYRDLVIPAPLKPLFHDVTDRIVFERLKDYALNEFFRRDVFIKGACARSDDTTRAYLDHTRFTTLAGEELVKRSVKLANYTLQFAGPIFDALIPALAARGLSVAELAATPELAAHGHEQLRDAVLHLALGEQLWPLLHAVPDLAPAAQGSFRAASAHNRMILEQPLSPGGLVVLACPATGTGIVASAIEVMCMRALGAAPATRLDWLRDFVGKQPVSLHVEGKSVQGPEAQVLALGQQVDQFLATRVPKLVQLGILQAAP